MKLVFLPSSRRDLQWMRRNYAEVFPDGAKRAAGRYARASGVLRVNPLAGRPGEDMGGIRELTIPRTPFSFIYRVAEDRIEVLRIWDQRGDRSKLG